MAGKSKLAHAACIEHELLPNLSVPKINIISNPSLTMVSRATTSHCAISFALKVLCTFQSLDCTVSQLDRSCFFCLEQFYGNGYERCYDSLHPSHVILPEALADVFLPSIINTNAGEFQYSRQQNEDVFKHSCRLRRHFQSYCPIHILHRSGLSISK